MTAKFAATLAAGVASVALCAGAAAAATTAEAPKSVYFIFTGYAYPYFAPMAEAVKQAANHYPDMSIRIVNANNSASDEISDINEAVAAGARGIILNTVQESVTATAEKAMKAGVPVVTVDRRLPAGQGADHPRQPGRDRRRARARDVLERFRLLGRC